MSVFKYEIKKHIATISAMNDGRFTLELNLISYGDNPARYDLRKWDRAANKMLRGVTFTADDAQKILEALQKELS